MDWPLGAYVDQLLKERNWKNTDLARAAKLSDTYIGYLVRGYTSDKPNPPSISIDTLIALSKAFDIPEIKLIAAYKGKDPNNSQGGQQAESDKAIREILKISLSSLSSDEILTLLLNSVPTEKFIQAIIRVDGPDKFRELLTEAKRRFDKENS
jgi:transcriptional regulator with XRE-family HTH domain